MPDTPEPRIDARDCFFFAGLAAVGAGLWLAFGLAAALVGTGFVLLAQAMRP